MKGDSSSRGREDPHKLRWAWKLENAARSGSHSSIDFGRTLYYAFANKLISLFIAPDRTTDLYFTAHETQSKIFSPVPWQMQPDDKFTPAPSLGPNSGSFCFVSVRCLHYVPYQDSSQPNEIQDDSPRVLFRKTNESNWKIHVYVERMLFIRLSLSFSFSVSFSMWFRQCPISRDGHLLLARDKYISRVPRRIEILIRIDMNQKKNSDCPWKYDIWIYIFCKRESSISKF